MDELRAYRDRRLELGDMIRAALYMARACGDDQGERRARELVARLAADQFQLAVVGQFSRGKTTLMNALLRGAYLPMGALPMTSVITRVRYGSRPRAMVRRRSSRLAVEVPLADVARFVAASSAERAELQVATVEVEVPAEILRLGFELVDTPGVGSAIAANTATTRKFVPQADAVLFVTGFDSPLTEAEVSFLADAVRHAGKLFLVLNKRDLVSAREADEVAEFVRYRVREDLRLGEPRLFGLSALQALEATTSGDSERLADSGLAPLYVALSRFLATGKTRLFLSNVAKRAAALVAVRRRDLQLGRVASLGGSDRAAALTAFTVRLAELDQERRSLADEITAIVESRLPSLLAAGRSTWQASLHELLGPCLETALQADPGSPARDRAIFTQATLEAAGRGIALDWLARRTGEVLELATGITADKIGALLQVARAPRIAAARVAGLAEDDDDPGPVGWTADDLPGLIVRPPEWTVRMPPPRRFLSRPDGGAAGLRDRAAEALAGAIAAFEAGARISFCDAARDWARRLGEQADRQAADEAAYVRRCLHATPTDVDVAAVDDLSTRLAGFQAALDELETHSDEDTGSDLAPVSSPETAVVRGVGCAVCEQMETTLKEHLRREQFRLATIDYDQERHALTGGYCPLHTWQYASIASPLGISAGYAKLATSVADALESISRNGGAAGDLASLVAAVGPRAGTCPLCAVLAVCERDMISEITARSPADGGGDVLCLRHLSLALRTDPQPEAARNMIRMLAGTLRRDAEDMRAYALKREAPHGATPTAEESSAHLDALRRIAGLSALNQP